MTGIVGTTGAASGALGTITKAAGGAGGLWTSTQTFTSNGTWTKPAGITRIFVELVAAGGGGSGHCESGAAGGYAAEWLDVSAVASVIVTVGIGGAGSNYGSTGGTGGASSFGTYLSGSAGTGGTPGPSHRGGIGGQGSGGQLNVQGGGGTGHGLEAQGTSGSSYFGGGSPQRHSGQVVSHETQGGYGGGGVAAQTSVSRGAQANHGVCVVWEYS